MERPQSGALDGLANTAKFLTPLGKERPSKLGLMISEIRIVSGQIQRNADYIFAGERRGTPLNLKNLVRCVILPAQNKNTEAESVALYRQSRYGLGHPLAGNLGCVRRPKVRQTIMRSADMGVTLNPFTQTEDVRPRPCFIVDLF